MDGPRESRQVSSESPQYSHSAGLARELPEQRPSTQSLRSGGARTTPHKPTPLQVSETSPLVADDAYPSSRSPRSPTALRSASDKQYVSRSPRSNLAATMEEPKSPQARLEDLLAAENDSTNEDASSADSGSIRNATASPSKAQSYSQLRNVSSPFPESRRLGNSSPPSPRSTATPPHISSALREEVGHLPRTSSIDSAISTISMGTSNAQRPSPDHPASSTPDITNLISTAGSAEAAIQHLLRDKQHAATQNAQLWKLVDKQRSLVLGLNQDLKRALEDKERYRKKLKDHLDMVPPMPTPAPKTPAPQPRAASYSPAPSDASAELPIQRQSLEHTVPSFPQSNVPKSAAAGGQSDRTLAAPKNLPATGLEEADNWVKSKDRTTSSKHSHKQTSSSDIGILGPSNPYRDVTPIKTGNLNSPPQQALPERPSQSGTSSKPVGSPTASFTAKRSQTHPAKPFDAPTLAVTESTPTSADNERMTPPRKPPPAPLHLGQPKPETRDQQRSRSEDRSGSDYDDDLEVDELPSFGRGRRMTREDDDLEREAALFMEKEGRSRSKKSKGSKTPSETSKSRPKENGSALQQQKNPMPPAIKALSPEPSSPGLSTFLAPPSSLAGVLNSQGTQRESNITERTVAMKSMSPGLPVSPRPSDRPGNPPTPRMPRDGVVESVVSPPLSPRTGVFGLPLSPRAPRQHIPHPPHTPMSMAPASPVPDRNEGIRDPSPPTRDPASPGTKPMSSLQTQGDQEQGSSTSQSTEGSRSKGIFTGFISDAYPGLLIPPNALPSIRVKVVSSRLKPSRQSLVLKGADDEPVFTLGISARYDRQDLWQVEKPILSLQQLDQQLRQSSAFNVKLPDRSLFSGHAPAKIDARRVALEKYFEAVLDTQMDEKAALALCNYISTQVSEPSSKGTKIVATAPHSGPPTTQGTDGRLVKEGYLTKRGKNFGGWKARFFVLDEPVLRYYETPGGTLLGTIKLQNAQIGKQSHNKASGSPSRGDDGDGQYRHAFLIREPKRKDSSSFMDHVLCAESDAERDAWVAALLCYVEGNGLENKSRTSLATNNSSSSKDVIPNKNNSLKRDATLADSPDSENFDSLQGVPYEETKPAEAPIVHITPDILPNETPSPTTSQPSIRAPSAQSKNISGPQNGAKIDNVGAWGNKPMAAPLTNPKEQKKRSIWGFRDKNASENGVQQPSNVNLSLTQQQYQEQITNVKAAFGAPLAEAVEFCAPRGIDVCLPAVVYRCLEYLEAKDAASEEGIFRMSGSNTLIKGLRNKFNAEGDFDFLGPDEVYYDVHAVASLLKLYLRELPSMILTRDLHIQFLSVLELKDDSQKVAAYNVLVHKLPKPNFTLIRALSAYLISIVNNAEVNLMGVRNVCIVFSPTLNIPAPVFSVFLTQFEAVFGEAPEDSSIPALEVTESAALTPDDIRSPRRQMFSDIPTPSFNQESFAVNPQNPSYEQAHHDHHGNNDTGFIPMQPAYDTPLSVPYSQTQQPGSVTVAGPEYAVAKPRNLAPGGSAKSRRRESSMLLMGSGQRKNSLPLINNNGDPTHEDRDFY